uniref:Oxidoreductase n=1 Tax=Chaetoceros debilis TaxID=122233 RepID=A0A7S3V764_9STRA|mmetsp:Transcript_27301/g.41854  ORF Transcript_27301/g.41854 Transcript_27301/m.41854 type:complete len:675 (+) Transcript_27301:62-2086(+)
MSSVSEKKNTGSSEKKKFDDGSKPKVQLPPEAVLPQLSDAETEITQADLLIATKVLTAISKLHPKHKMKGQSKKRTRDESLKLYQHSNLRLIRKALAGAFDLHKLQLYKGRSEEEHYANQLKERTLKRQKMAEREQQKKYIENTELRSGRIKKLEQLKMDAKEEEEGRLKMQALMVPDGHVDTEDFDVKMIEDGSATTTKEEGVTDEGVKLPQLRSCYVCKVRYRDLHPFYDQLCPKCAKLNYEKRHFKVDMSGKVAIVTGSRVKIGYQVCLKLLRSGCKVVATTRFPNSAAATYRKEKDFHEWKDNLSIYGLDLRDVIGLEAFTRFLKIKFGVQGIDALINNACQTIRRPTAYYKPVVETETEIWEGADDTHKNLLRGCMEFETLRRQLLIDQKQVISGTVNSVGVGMQSQSFPALEEASKSDTSTSHSNEEKKESASDQTSDAVVKVGPEDSLAKGRVENIPFEDTGLSHSAAMSQMVILPDDVGVSSEILPPGMSDINGHQLDLRTSNSWLLKMDQISTPEVMECMYINAIAPFVLNSRLQPLMTSPAGDQRPDRYIINVSAMEGKFYRYKMPNHPHTNMAKAALNMLTRTSSEELAKKHRIFMNSVDTGWINDENPLEKASKIAKTNLFQTPIDEVDAAARILDPVFVGVKGVVRKDYGKFFKDFRETEW